MVQTSWATETGSDTGRKDGVPATRHKSPFLPGQATWQSWAGLTALHRLERKILRGVNDT